MKRQRGSKSRSPDNVEKQRRRREQGASSSSSSFQGSGAPSALNLQTPEGGPRAELKVSKLTELKADGLELANHDSKIESKNSS